MRSASEQLELLRRGVDGIVPEPEFLKKLERSVATNTPLRVKYGIDPTGIDVHLGHTVPLRKLRQFQDLGHTAVIIIGNYTALVGDPSGRDETRQALTEEQVAANAKDYLRQVGRIIDLERAEVHHNGDWFGKWTFLDVLDLTRKMTLGQISARDDFSKRIKAEKPVYLHECLYPLMQGWDSVEIRADVELGGTEQLFSLMVARDLQIGEGQPGQVAMTMPILVGTDGTRRMGKSLGNYIGVYEEDLTGKQLPRDIQFGKIMSIPDEPLRQYLMLLTDLPVSEIDRLLSPEVNPRDAKDKLATSIVEEYHGQGSGKLASESFRQAAKDRENKIDPPDEAMVRAELSRSELDTDGKMPAPRLIVKAGLRGSTSQARQLMQGGGFNIGPDRTVIRDPNTMIEVVDGLIVRAGTRIISRIHLKP